MRYSCPLFKHINDFYCLVIVPLFFVMALFKFVNILFLCSILFSQDPYSLEDVNPNSITYVKCWLLFFSEKVVLHYFGAFTWGTCTARFGELNEINDDLKNSGYQVELIGVSKSSWQAGLVNWTNQGSAAICIDESPYLVWDDWEAIQRDLFITDLNGQVVYKQNITSGIPSNIVDIISGYLNVHQEILPDKFLLKQNYLTPLMGLQRLIIQYHLPHIFCLKYMIWMARKLEHCIMGITTVVALQKFGMVKIKTVN